MKVHKLNRTSAVLTLTGASLVVAWSCSEGTPTPATGGEGTAGAPNLSPEQAGSNEPGPTPTPGNSSEPTPSASDPAIPAPSDTSQTGAGGSADTNGGTSGSTGMGGTDAAGAGGNAAGEGGGGTPEPPSPSLPDGLEFKAYWPDMEGGGGTVWVAPGGEVFVSDTGNADEHGRRILTILKDVIGTDHIDHLITTHYDPDHIRGFGVVADGIEVRNYVDLGGRGMGKEPRMIAKPGDTIPLKDAELTFVAGDRQTLQMPLGADEPNPKCDDRETDFNSPGGDQVSLGYIVKSGDFEFVEMGDLTWQFLDALVCPVNVLGGEVDVAQIARHGQTGSSIRQWVNTINPTVAVMNNAFQKGADEESMASLLTVPALGPDLSGLWHVYQHRERAANEQGPVDHAANIPGDANAHYISLVAKGSTITVTNSRNGFSKTYAIK